MKPITVFALTAILIVGLDNIAFAIDDYYPRLRGQRVQYLVCVSVGLSVCLCVTTKLL